ncbi:uncharacterized protein LOC121875547 [Homarus americanus]|uniref:uncharacterized protein LOC121875547 n=1 Tax=Homarus americanus TaxID=6706 RepID=UPI001C47D36C|nr:uncharacterized protein LOC121875547 [Homarus americanus]
MAGHLVPVDFRVNPAKVSNPVERKTLLQDLLPIIETFSGPLTETSVCEVPGGNHVVLCCSDTMTLTVKLYFNGLVTANVEYYTDQVNEHKIVNDRIFIGDYNRKIEDNEYAVERLCMSSCGTCLTGSDSQPQF